MPLRTLIAFVLAALVLAAACAADDTDERSTTNGGEMSGEGTVSDGEGTVSDGEGTVSDGEGTVSDGDGTAATDAADDEADVPDALPLGEQVGAITVVGEPLDVMPPRIPVTEAGNDPAIGQRAPEISGTDFSGAPVEIKADGTPRVVMFVAHWCPHCQREVPAVKELIDAGAVPAGLELVLVSTAVREGEDNYPPQTWLNDVGWPGPVIRDSEGFEALLAFGVGGFPFSVYLDADHEVVTRSAGEIPAEILQQLWLATVDS